ncbi:hypothetical protein CANCADRAFT_31721 [Tortispora caseinolytica NRRL Y-17796]|uniref:Carboxypeptidase n=1 Tax=Tortispora caseinolytica NRRL Y-17796 TaxID=767744 RepID=A0A1E4TGJ1_9ASCO|nr:hypothetical protein CANCADRAFT_31721 [Tortispora caseinolytica NRRL Y-17796]
MKAEILCGVLAASQVSAISLGTGFFKDLPKPDILKNILNHQEVINGGDHDEIIDSLIKAAIPKPEDAMFLNSAETVAESVTSMWKEAIESVPGVEQKLKSMAQAPPKSATKRQFPIVVESEDHPGYRIRAKQPNGLGIDPDVKQYSGYIDIEEEDKHLFFWFFESRNDPKNDPVVLWLNGGPGCSSLTGMFFELGPASVDENLKIVPNEYSWNNNASVIFLDQPVNVGFSYSSNTVSNTRAAGEDVYAFLSLFFKQFKEYSDLPFHIAGESYAGHYIPDFANEILNHPKRNFNLDSVLIGNGLTNADVQYQYYLPMACGGKKVSGVPVLLEDSECESMQSSLPTCMNLIKTCHQFRSTWTCFPAAVYCNNAQLGPFQKTGLNIYDVREKCTDQEALCYPQTKYVEKYLNQPEVLEAIGAEVSSYEGCNMNINRDFLMAGDWMEPFQDNVTNVLHTGTPVLIYAGDKDFICNWLGNEAWTNQLEWFGQAGFKKAAVKDFEVSGEAAGKVKSFDLFTFLRIYEAGHMVPFNQPEASLAMLNRWISGNKSLKE